MGIEFEIESIHSSWLYCFTDPLELGTRVSLSHRQPHVVYIFNYKMFHQEASVETIKKIIWSYKKLWNTMIDEQYTI